jgi:hypothetical protein
MLISVQLEMKEKNGRYRAGRLEEVAFPRPQEDLPLWFSQMEIAGLHKLETLEFKRLPEIFRGVGETPDFNGLVFAPKGAAPPPRLRLGVHIRDENMCVRSRHTRQFACKRSRVEEVTDGKRAHNNISHLRSKRKRKTISQDEAIPKQRLGGRTDDHLGAGIYAHHRTRAAAKELAEPAAGPAANVQGVLVLEERQDGFKFTFLKRQQRVRIVVISCSPKLVAFLGGNANCVKIIRAASAPFRLGSQHHAGNETHKLSSLGLRSLKYRCIHLNSIGNE